LNEILDARMTRARNIKSATSGNPWNGYSHIKRRWSQEVKIHVLAQHFPILTEAYFTYLFNETSQRRDPSNFVSGGIKLIEDGIKHAGHIPNDGWRNVLGIRGFWRVGFQPGVHVFATTDDCMTFEEAVFEADRPVEKPGRKPKSAPVIDLSPLEID